MSLDKLLILQARNLHKSEFELSRIIPSGSEERDLMKKLKKSNKRKLYFLNFISDIGLGPTMCVQYYVILH